MQASDSLSDVGASAAGFKRPRHQIRAACTKCKQRRVKCTGIVPCRRCEEIGESNSCTIPQRTARASKSTIWQLERRVEELTLALEAARRDSTLQSAIPATDYHIQQTATSPKVERALFLASSNAPPAQRQFAPAAWGSEDESDGELEEEQANASRKVEGLFKNERHPYITWLGPAKTRTILQLYADHTQPIHPVLAWSAFLDSYNQHEAFLPFVQDRVWLATLQVVIAHAMQTVSPESSLDISPSTFFAESLQILGFSTMLATTTPALVQCLILMTAFAQTINEPDLSISLLGLAIQKCKALGFTLEGPNVSHDRIARLCVSGCLSRDFYVSVALGRAPFLSEHDCRADLLPLSKEEDASLRLPNAKPHALAFFHEGIKLHHVVYRALHRVYPLVGGRRFEVNLLQELDHRLLSWHDDLPAFLQPEKCSPVSREASYIQLRFWYSRNLVHRPALCHLLSTEVLSFTRGLELDVLVLCSKVATEAGLQLIDRLHPVMRESTTAWWINLIALYSACLTLILAIKLDQKNILSNKVSPDRCDTALEDALSTLKHFSALAGTRLPAASRTAEYCANDIRRLRGKVRPTAAFPPAVQQTPPSALLPPVESEPWLFSGYDWSGLFDIPPLPSNELSTVGSTTFDNGGFDFSQLLVNPGMPRPQDEEQEEMFNWLTL